MIIKRLQTEGQVQVASKPGCEPGVNRDDQSQNCQKSNNQLNFGISPHVSAIRMKRIPLFHILKSRVSGKKRSHTRKVSYGWLSGSIFVSFPTSQWLHLEASVSFLPAEFRCHTMLRRGGQQDTADKNLRYSDLRNSQHDANLVKRGWSLPA